MEANYRGFECVYVEKEGLVRLFNVNGKTAPFFIAKSNDAKRYASYRLISKELSNAFDALSLLKINTIQNDTIKQSLSFFAIVSYGKCFTESEGRKVRLEKSSALKYASPQDIQEHDKIMDMRHNYVAHGGVGGYEQNPVCVALDPEDTTKVIRFFDNVTFVSNIDSRIDYFMSLISVVNKFVEEKIQKHKGALSEELNNLNISTIEDQIILPNDNTRLVIKSRGVPEG